MIACIAVFASFSLDLARASDEPPNCADALSTEAVRSFLSKTLGSDWDARNTSRFADAVLLERGRLPARDRHVGAVLVEDEAHRHPFVIVSNGRDLEMVGPGAKDERVVLVEGRPRWTSDGGWKKTVDDRALATEPTRELADLFERHRNAVAKLVAEQGLSVADLRAASLMPFSWEGRAAAVLSIADVASGRRRLFFVREDQYWTAEEITRTFHPHVDFLRIDGHLLYRRHDDHPGEGNVVTTDGTNVQLVADFDSKKIKPSTADAHVGNLLGSVPHRFRELLIAPRGPLAVKDLSNLRAVHAREVPDGRTFSVLIHDDAEGETFGGRIVAVLDEHSSREYFRLQFLRPRRLRLEGGRTVDVVLRDEQWLTLSDPNEQVDALLAGFGRGDVQSSR